MRALVVLAALIGCSFAATCIHSNSADLTEEHVIKMVVTAADSNDDGIISEIDILLYFVKDFDHDFNLKVDESEFVKQWHNSFHDNEGFAQHVFHSIDTNDDGALDMADVDPLVARVDTSGNDEIEISEFKKYLEDIYKAC